MKNVEENDRQQVIPKPSGSQLAKMPKNTAALFVSASVGRLSNLYPHWLVLNIETPHGNPSSRLIVLWQLQAYRVLTMGQIANAIDLTPRGVTRIVDGLESDGFVKRTYSKHDKRVRTVERADFRLHGESISQKSLGKDDVKNVLRMQRQAAEPRAIRRIYGIKPFKDENLSLVVDGILYHVYRLKKGMLRAMYGRKTKG